MNKKRTEPAYKLSCGCPSEYGGIPAEWPAVTREGEPATEYGVICEKHWHEYGAQHPSEHISYRKEPNPWAWNGCWNGCGDCDCSFPCYNGADRCIRLQPKQKDQTMNKNYNSFQVQKEILLEYMQVMIALQDWHGVADAAMDIRELEARNQKTEQN